jgi:hypothetical protein
MRTVRRGLVYALCDRHGEPYYVGRTTRTAGERLGEHRREATRRMRRSACHLRTLELIDQGDGPAIWVLESGIPLVEVMTRERWWIAYAKGVGWKLRNYTGGGGSMLTMDRYERERQAAIAAAFPRDACSRFLPFGVAEAVGADGQVCAPLNDEWCPF